MRLIFLFTKVFNFFKYQCFPLHNSSLGQLHNNGDIVSTFGSSAEVFNWYGLQHVCYNRSVLIFLIKSPMSKISLVVWSQIMNHGFLNTILRPRDKIRRGTVWALLDQRKLEWANRRSNQCWFFLQKVNRPFSLT